MFVRVNARYTKEKDRFTKSESSTVRNVMYFLNGMDYGVLVVVLGLEANHVTRIKSKIVLGFN